MLKLCVRRSSYKTVVVYMLYGVGIQTPVCDLYVAKIYRPDRGCEVWDVD